MAALSISLAAEPIATIAGLQITNSLFTSWIVVYLLCLFVMTRHYSKSLYPSALQNAIEYPIEQLYNFAESISAKRALEFFPLIATFFIFILFSNWIGLIPGVGTIGIKEGEHIIPFLRAPTADLNTTIALALISVISVQYYGIKHRGKAYLQKFFTIKNPIFTFVGILELVSEIAKLVSFSFRLFGNVFAGEALLVVMSYLVPFLIPAPFYILEMVVGFIQAFVFAALTLVFLHMATDSEASH